MKKFLMLGAAALATLTLAACADTGTGTAYMEAGTTKMEQKLEKEKSKTERLKAQAEQGSSDDKKTVPDVTGMDHQLAQDTLQAAGFYLLDEIDCSGQDRMMLWDRNWTVEEQEPAAGTPLSTDGTVTLCSVKDGE
jgi:beta-lactam-binding protein with PASTA domain